MSPAKPYLWLLLSLQILDTKPSKIPLKCPDVPKLPVLSGYGWDSLTNQDTKQVLDFTYNQCRVTEDGKYLIPDETIVVMTKGNDYQVISELIEHWTLYSSIDSAGFKIPTDMTPPKLLPLFSSFSDEYHELKELQIKHQAITVRTQLRQLKYRINVARDAPITSSIKERLRHVMRSLSKNFTEQAEYLLQILVRDYGTHYSKSIEVGAVYIKDDYLPTSFYRNNQDQVNKIISSAKISFLDFLGFSWSHKRELDSSLLKEYDKEIIYGNIKKIGEPNWDKGVGGDKMAIIDRSGDLLTGLLTTSNFPNAPLDLLEKAEEMLGFAIQDYFRQNTHKGCTKLKSPNFNYIANLDDGSCTHPIHHFAFGGTFQNCTYPVNAYVSNYCNGYNTDNIITQNQSCPYGFTAMLLYSEIAPYTFSVSGYSLTSYRNLTTYYCMTRANTSVYAFGGLYSEVVDNIQTKKKTCSLEPWYNLTVFNGKLSMCVYKIGNKTNDYILPFGGFTTGKTGLRCPPGYKNHLALMYDNNEIHYCLQERNTSNYGVRPLLERPPYLQTKINVIENGLAEDGKYNLSMPEEISETLNTTAAGVGVVIYIVIALVLVLVFTVFGLLYWQRRHLRECFKRRDLEQPVAWVKKDALDRHEESKLCKPDKKQESLQGLTEYEQPIPGARRVGKESLERTGLDASGTETCFVEDNLYE